VMVKFPSTRQVIKIQIILKLNDVERGILKHLKTTMYNNLFDRFQ